MSDLEVIKEIEDIVDKQSVRYKTNNKGEVVSLEIAHLSENFDINVIGQLKKVEVLVLIGNQIIDINIFKELKYLNSLHLYDAKILDITVLRNFKNLKTLVLGNNNISDISVFFELVNVEVVSIFDNNVIDLTPIKHLKYLEALDLRGNPIKVLPEWIIDFNMDIHYTNDYKQKGILLYDNPLESPPIEIVKQGKEAIKNYFENLKNDEEVELFEAKMLLVGDGWVGKTCVLNRLLYNTFEEVNSTEGIDIHKWNIETHKTTEFKVNVWDFGGQEIYHNTHQFFLTKRSLYIFVWEARRDAVYRMAFGFWLNTIKMLSADSPIIMVQNKTDERKMEIDEFDTRRAFPNIVAFLNVSAKTGEGFDELRHLIADTISKLPHIGNKLPLKWLQIRQHLENLPQLAIAKNTIDYTEYKDICFDNNTDPEKSAFLARYYHDLGVFLHFHDNAILKLLVFLNPEWATEAVYRVLDDRTLQENKGKFDFLEFSRIWHDYPETQYIQLIELMQRFELCFQIPHSQTYIIPELIRANRPEFVWDYSGNLRFQYQYKFMPAGVLTRFIVLAHHLIDSNLYWKSGCILRLNGSSALIEVEHYDSRINIWITGNSKENLLSVIRYHIDYIHQNLKPTTAEEMIPCNCAYCESMEQPHFWDYREVLLRLEMNIAQDFCPKALSEAKKLVHVSIKGLLGRSETLDKKISLTEALLVAIQQLQSLEKAIGIGKKEDNRNTFIANVLNNKGFRALDQTFRGSSKSGLQAGEVDILVKNSENSDISIIEAMNLDGLKTQSITEHILKLIQKYDRNGLPENYMVIYCDSDNFNDLWNDYKTTVSKINYGENHIIGSVEDISESVSALEIKMAKTIHQRHAAQQTIYHVFVNMNFSF